MWYVYYFDSQIYSSELETFETEKLALKFISDLVNRGERLDGVKLIQGTEIKLKAIEVATRVVRAYDRNQINRIRGWLDYHS